MHISRRFSSLSKFPQSKLQQKKMRFGAVCKLRMHLMPLPRCSRWSSSPPSGYAGLQRIGKSPPRKEHTLIQEANLSMLVHHHGDGDADDDDDDDDDDGGDTDAADYDDDEDDDNVDDDDDDDDHDHDHDRNHRHLTATSVSRATMVPWSYLYQLSFTLTPSTKSPSHFLRSPPTALHIACLFIDAHVRVAQSMHCEAVLSRSWDLPRGGGPPKNKWTSPSRMQQLHWLCEVNDRPTVPWGSFGGWFPDFFMETKTSLAYLHPGILSRHDHIIIWKSDGTIEVILPQMTTDLLCLNFPKQKQQVMGSVKKSNTIILFYWSLHIGILILDHYEFLNFPHKLDIIVIPDKSLIIWFV